MTSTSTSVLFTPDQVNELFIEPVIAQAIATHPSVSTVVRLRAGTWRAPRVTDDPSAAWVAEGAEIPVSDAELDEIEVQPRKLAGLTVVTSETIEDTNETAAAVIGDGLTRDTSRKLDAAFIANGSAPAPSGLAGESFTPIVGGTLTDLEAFARAAAAVEDIGANITAWITGSAMALRLAGLRQADGSNLPLLGTDPALPSRRVAEGRPVFVVPGVGANTVWGVDASRNYTIVRTDAEVVSDGSVFFTSDRVAIRSRLRAGFGFVQPKSIVKLTYTAAT